MSNLITPHRFTVDEYEQMIATGILKHDDRVELIRGEIREMSPIGDAHASRVNRLNSLLCLRTEGRAIVNVQNPIVLADSEPEPDFALLRYKPDFYESGKPTGADVLLVIEVSDSTLEFDREIKAPLYAEAGIPEYWIINLVEGCLEVYRSPESQGYGTVLTLYAGDQIEIPGLSVESLSVSELVRRVSPTSSSIDSL